MLLKQHFISYFVWNFHSNWLLFLRVMPEHKRGCFFFWSQCNFLIDKTPADFSSLSETYPCSTAESCLLRPIAQLIQHVFTICLRSCRLVADLLRTSRLQCIDFHQQSPDNSQAQRHNSQRTEAIQGAAKHNPLCKFYVSATSPHIFMSKLKIKNDFQYVFRC